MEIPLLVMPRMMSQILKSVDFTKAQKSWEQNIIFSSIKKLGITKSCMHLLHPAHFSLHLALCNTLSVIRIKISHVIEQFSSFWLKIGTHGLLEELILNLHLGFWNFDPKIYFWANLGRKSQSCPFCLKTDTHGWGCWFWFQH